MLNDYLNKILVWLGQLDYAALGWELSVLAVIRLAVYVLRKAFDSRPQIKAWESMISTSDLGAGCRTWSVI